MSLVPLAKLQGSLLRDDVTAIVDTPIDAGTFAKIDDEWLVFFKGPAERWHRVVRAQRDFDGDNSRFTNAADHADGSTVYGYLPPD